MLLSAAAPMLDSTRGGSRVERTKEGGHDTAASPDECDGEQEERQETAGLSWLVPVLALGSLSSRTGFVPTSPSSEAEEDFRLGDVIDPFEGGEYSFATVPGCDHLGLAGHPNLVSSGDGGPTTHEVLMRNPAFVNRTDFVVAHCNVGNRGRPENRGADVLAGL